MATVTKFPLLILFISFLAITPSISSPTNNLLVADIDHWCGQTPYPDTCRGHFTSSSLQSSSLGVVPIGSTLKKTDFQKLTIQAAMNSAVVAHTRSKGLGPRLKNSLEKAAWDDCESLLEETVSQLNRTLLAPQVKATSFDQQTWLSAALTNLETCKAGFVELGVDSSAATIFPLMFNNVVNSNVSQLISNSLAITANNATSSQNVATYEDGFPTWLSKHDRKLLQSSSAASSANLVVAQDGSGNYKTIGEALAAAASGAGSGRFVIHVKSGVYKENIATKLKNIMLVGDGMSSTIITGSRSVVGGSTTFNSATFATTGSGFIAQGITFRNTAGPSNHQAVALRSGSDLSVFYQCGFEGYQDTLYTYSMRQFYKSCNIYGTVDFIFGNAAVSFQNCNIYVRKPNPSQKNTVTAQGRTDSNQNTGIVIQGCTITAASDLKPVISSFPTYLGRPWKQYSRTVVMESNLDSLINPAGWLEWDGDFALSTLFYAEYKNTGPGSSTTGRVKWGGYKVITSATEATAYTVASFIAGNSWLPATGVPYTAGL